MFYKANWCSIDPVFTELSENGGKVYGFMNMVCCGQCGLLPETSYKNFNYVLDRNTLVNHSKTGYFD